MAQLSRLIIDDHEGYSESRFSDGLPGLVARRAAVREQIWAFYQQLKAYKQGSDELTRQRLEACFDEILLRKPPFTGSIRRSNDFTRTKSELLLALQRPQIPLHNNPFSQHLFNRISRQNCITPPPVLIRAAVQGPWG